MPGLRDRHHHLGAVCGCDNEVENVREGHASTEYRGQLDGQLVELIMSVAVHADVDVWAAGTHAQYFTP